MVSIKYWINSVIIVFVAVLYRIVVADNCTIPGGETGECISIHKCPIILETIKNRYEDLTTVKFARKSHCGFGPDRAPLVCCGKINNYTTLPADLLSSRSYCGFQHSDDYVTNKNENGTSSIDEFPWLAALFYQVGDTEKNLCVGSLINGRYVLTAAHCLRINKLNATLTKVRLGEYNIELKDDCIDNGHLSLAECSEPTADFGVEELIAHTLYNKSQNEHDIGLIRLNSTVQYSDYIRPICLPLPDTPRAKSGDILVESGWGRTTYQGVAAKIKKKISTKLIPYNICANIYKSRYNYTIRKGQMCTKDILVNSTATCSGDSGGPVMFSHKNQWSQEGIVSYGGRCASGHPDVHTKVADYVNWIIRNIRP